VIVLLLNQPAKEATMPQARASPNGNTEAIVMTILHIGGGSSNIAIGGQRPGI